jgi:hypothetical protein
VHSGQIAGMDFGYREGVEVLIIIQQRCNELLAACV